MYSKSIKINPDYADVYYNRGLCHYFIATIDKWEPNLHELNIALVDFDNALLIDPDMANAWLYRGKIYAMEGLSMPIKNIFDFQKFSGRRNVDEALKSFNEARRIIPNSVTVLFSFGDLFIHDDYDRAQKYYEDILRIEPTNFDAMLLKNICLKNKGEDITTDDLDKEINENPTNPEVWFKRSLFWFGIRNFDLCKSDFNQAIKYKLSNINKYINIGQQNKNGPHLGYDEKLYIEGLKHYPDSAELCEALKNYYQEQGDLCQKYEKHDTAIEYFTKAIKYATIIENINNKEKTNGG